VGKTYRTRIIAAGASDCLVKPFSMAELVSRLHDLLGGVPAPSVGAVPWRTSA
jgi:DNA-binding response OmpR family regulator